MLTQLDFGGFYNSYHDDIVTRAVAMDVGADDENTGEVEWNDDMDKADFQTYRVSYSKKYVEALNYELDTRMEFHKLDSPREYNFSTDVIMVNASTKDCLQIFDYVKRYGLKPDVWAWLKDATTRRDGYSPFYSMEDMFKSENRYFLIQAMLSVIIEQLSEDYPFTVEHFYL